MCSTSPTTDEMRSVRAAVFVVDASPSRVTEFLSNPRNLVAANHAGPIIEGSDPPVAAGSWFVVAFDQLRMRVEYGVFEPSRRVAGTITWTGRLSGGTRSSFDFVLTPEADGTRTRIAAMLEGRGNPIVTTLSRLAQPLVARQMRARFQARLAELPESPD